MQTVLHQTVQVYLLAECSHVLIICSYEYTKCSGIKNVWVAYFYFHLHSRGALECENCHTPIYAKIINNCTHFTVPWNNLHIPSLPAFTHSMEVIAGMQQVPAAALSLKALQQTICTFVMFSLQYEALPLRSVLQSDLWLWLQWSWSWTTSTSYRGRYRWKTFSAGVLAAIIFILSPDGIINHKFAFRIEVIETKGNRQDLRYSGSE